MSDPTPTPEVYDIHTDTMRPVGPFGAANIRAQEPAMSDETPSALETAQPPETVQPATTQNSPASEAVQMQNATEHADADAPDRSHADDAAAQQVAADRGAYQFMAPLGAQVEHGAVLASGPAVTEPAPEPGPEFMTAEQAFLSLVSVERELLTGMGMRETVMLMDRMYAALVAVDARIAV